MYSAGYTQVTVTRYSDKTLEHLIDQLEQGELLEVVPDNQFSALNDLLKQRYWDELYKIYGKRLGHRKVLEHDSIRDKITCWVLRPKITVKRVVKLLASIIAIVVIGIAVFYLGAVIMLFGEFLNWIQYN